MVFTGSHLNASPFVVSSSGCFTSNLNVASNLNSGMIYPTFVSGAHNHTLTYAPLSMDHSQDPHPQYLTSSDADMRYSLHGHSHDDRPRRSGDVAWGNGYQKADYKLDDCGRLESVEYRDTEGGFSVTFYAQYFHGGLTLVPGKVDRTTDFIALREAARICMEHRPS